MTDSSSIAFLEALLFLVGEPMALSDLASSAGMTKEELTRGLDTLEKTLQERRSGLRLLRAPEGVQLITAPEHAERIEAFLKSGMREQLTPAAAETLAIVAYRGPISRAGVEAIRGVNSSFTLRLLAIRGLVDRTPHPTDSRIHLYRVSADFLRHLGTTRIEDLPSYAQLHEHEGMTALEATAAIPEETSTDETPSSSPPSP